MRAPVAHSYLFVPGNRPDRFAKACAVGADVVILDLEDAVAPAEKAAARIAVREWLTSDRSVLIRINDANSSFFRDDLSMCEAPGVAGIVLPKAERAEDVLLVAERTGSATPILPLIETAAGFWNAYTLAQTPGVQRLLFGSIDFQLDLQIAGDDTELLYFRSQLVLLSRVANIASPVDGVTPAIDDVARLRADTLRAKSLGFGAKLCLHPKQVSVVNACFAPTAEERAWAMRVLEAASASDGSAVMLDGKLVDRPIIVQAKRVLRQID